MLYDVAIEIAYAYERPAMNGRNLLRLAPAHLGETQRVVASSLMLDPPPEERSERTDFFGNRVTDAAWDSPHADLKFRLTARVHRNAVPPAFDISPEPGKLSAELQHLRLLGPRSPHHFLGPSPRIAASRELAAFARANVRAGMTTLAIAEALSKELHEHMEFDADATTVDTPPAEAFAKGRGVCQDYSHIMIAALRSAGIPAGYVSGVLRTIPPPGRERLEGADAMHAWVTVWCGQEMGWIEFDPTNAMRAGSDHIVVGYGRDYSDVAPVRGVLRISGAQTSKQSVDVVPVAAKAGD